MAGGCNEGVEGIVGLSSQLCLKKETKSKIMARKGALSQISTQFCCFYFLVGGGFP